jgi:putative component of toxin-antitoxin plasmid stabilization module
MDVHYYVTKAGRNEVDEWIAELANNRTEARILARIELRIDFGPGYRIYYAMIGHACVLLLCGGDKRKQSSDIERARKYLRDHRERALEV